MWHINSVTVPTGEVATIWGGLGQDVDTRALGDRLGPEGSQYVLSIPNIGALVLADTGGGPTTWNIQVNGGPTYSYQGEGQIGIALDGAGNATFSGGVGQLSVPVLSTMAQTGPVTHAVVSLVSGSPALQSLWSVNAWDVMVQAGFPLDAMTNLDCTFGDAPDCCAQLQTWLQSITFPDGAADELTFSWGCTLCKAWLTGLAAATVVVIVAVCIASGVGPAAVAALTEASAVAAVAEAVGVGVETVAARAVAAFAAAGAASIFLDFIEALCEMGGYCSSSAPVEGTLVVPGATRLA